jgi:Fe2+ transport system protein FeoA
MGFTKGTEVEFVRQAPLGDPVDLRLRGYRLSLRRIEAAVVIVAPLPILPAHHTRTVVNR